MKVETLDKAGYRKFGLTTAAIFVVLFGLIIPWLFDFGYPTWPWILAGLLATPALVAPIALQPVYIAWMKFGFVMNWINTRIILGIMFYGMFLPIGLVIRIFGKDSMRRRIDRTQLSYRVESTVEPKENVERPY